jgi:hypothetical protein
MNRLETVVTPTPLTQIPTIASMDVERYFNYRPGWCAAMRTPPTASDEAADLDGADTPDTMLRRLSQSLDSCVQRSCYMTRSNP